MAENQYGIGKGFSTINAMNKVIEFADRPNSGSWKNWDFLRLGYPEYGKCIELSAMKKDYD